MLSFWRPTIKLFHLLVSHIYCLFPIHGLLFSIRLIPKYCVPSKEKKVWIDFLLFSLGNYHSKLSHHHYHHHTAFCLKPWREFICPSDTQNQCWIRIENVNLTKIVNKKKQMRTHTPRHITPSTHIVPDLENCCEQFASCAYSIFLPHHWCLISFFSVASVKSDCAHEGNLTVITNQRWAGQHSPPVTSDAPCIPVRT